MRSVVGSRHALLPSQVASTLSLGRNFVARSPAPCSAGRASAPNAGCTSKPSRPPGQGVVGRLHGRIAVGDIDDAREIAADIGLERGAQVREVVRQIAVEGLLCILARWQCAPPCAQQQALRRRLDDHVGDEPGKIHVVGADGEQTRSRLRSGCWRRAVARMFFSSANCAGRGPRASCSIPTTRAFVGLLAGEQAGIDGGAGAGERDEASPRGAASRSRARARCAPDSCRASDGRPGSSSARRGAPSLSPRSGSTARSRRSGRR